MKSYKLLLGCAALLAMTGCVSEDMTGSSDKGVLSLDVSTRQPTATRAGEYEVTDFPVTIYKEDGTTRVESYDAVDAMPEKIRLDVGTYVLEAHTPGTMQRQMTYPYYKGTATSEILKDVTTQTTIVCKQQNGSIEVNYDEDFLALFTAWTITFDDGGDQALSIKNTNGNDPAAVYWAFGENVDKLTVNFRGTTADGNTITASKLLTKDQATETYDGETTNFGGGDAVVVNFTPVEATTGKVTIGITANIVFTETTETVTISVVDNGTLTPENPDDPQGPDDPTPGDDDKDTIGNTEDGTPYMVCVGKKTSSDTFTDTFSATASTFPNTQVQIFTPKGLASLKVTVAGGNAGFAGATGFLNNLEIIGSEDLGEIFSDVDGAELPNTGDTEYVFPLYAFYSMIQMFGATDANKAHEFFMVATDQEGNTLSATIKIVVTQ
jgi:hypothetical protein